MDEMENKRLDNIPDVYGGYTLMSRNERTPSAAKPQRDTRIVNLQKFETFFSHFKYLSLHTSRVI